MSDQLFPLQRTNKEERNKLLLSAVLFLWTLTVCLPGEYTVDSWSQYDQAVRGSFTDWYGTGVSFTWRCLWLVTGNYMSLYVALMLMYWAFFTLLVWPVRFNSFVYWTIMVFGLFFVFIGQSVMRDNLAASDWALAVVLFLYAEASTGAGRRRRNLTLLALFLLAHGLWVRFNTVAGALPLLYVGILLLSKKRLPLWRHLLLTFAACLLLFFAQSFMTYKVLKASKAYPEYKWKLLDVAGITKLTGVNYYPPEIRNFPQFNLDTVNKEYTPAGVDELYFRPKETAVFPPASDTIYTALSRSWKQAIRQHPFLYLRNRLEGFLYYLRLRSRWTTEEYYSSTFFWIQPGNPLDLKPEPETRLHRAIVALYRKLAYTWLFAPWFWLLLNLIAFVVFARRWHKSRQTTGEHYWLIQTCVQLSAIILVFSSLPIYQTDRDFRFFYWNAYVALIAIPAFFAQKESRLN